MKILIDILHPAHVNFFRNFITMMQSRGHQIIVTAREKDVALELLQHYKLPYQKISTLKKGFVNLARELVTRTHKLNRIIKAEKPDLLLGVMGASIALSGKIYKIPTLIFYNNETAKLTNFYAYRLASKFITSSSYEDKVPRNHITYHGYHELAYLHPQHFTPNKAAVEKLGINTKEKYFVMRFVSWLSSHDAGSQGFHDKVAFVREMAKYGKVIISAEKKLTLPKELQLYALTIPPHLLADVIAFAHLYVGESASVASDAACLGVPSIYLANTKRGYTNEQEHKFHLVYNYTAQEEALAKALEIAQRDQNEVRKEFQQKRQKLLHYCVDVTQWMAEFVEKYANEMVLGSSPRPTLVSFEK